MLRKKQKLENLEISEDEAPGCSLYDFASDCHGLVAGDEDILWLSENNIWLYKCEACHGFYYAFKYFFPQRICPYCRHDYNEPLDSYNDIKEAIAEIEDRDPYEHKTIQQIIEEKEGIK